MLIVVLCTVQVCKYSVGSAVRRKPYVNFVSPIFFGTISRQLFVPLFRPFSAPLHRTFVRLLFIPAGLVFVAHSGITPNAVLEAGHTEQIRTFQWMGRAVVTGGEDAKICSWRLPERGDNGNTGLTAGSSGGNHDDDGGDHDDDAMDDGR